MTTDIGETDANNYIIDSASTYRWYLKGANIQWADQSEIDILYMGTGVIQATSSIYKLKFMANITYLFTTFAHYENFLKAVGYWKKTPLLLTFVAKNEWGSNLLQYPDYDSPTTLTGFTGVLKNITFQRQAAAVEVKCQFYLATAVN